jgi:transcriptional regulator with XRE-family HTH domain
MTPPRFKAARFKLKLSQPAFAARLHMTERMIRNYESGKYPIPKTVEYSCYWLMLSDKLKKILLIKAFDLRK